MSALISKHPEYILYACNVFYKFPDREYVAWGYSQVSIVTLHDWGVSPDISMAGSIVRKEDYLSVGGFTSYDSYVEDLYLLVRLLLIGNAVITPDALYRYYRIHQHHKSSAKRRVWKSAIASLGHIMKTTKMTSEQSRVIEERIDLYRSYQRNYIIESLKYAWHVITRTTTSSKPYRALLRLAKKMLRKT